MSWNIAAGCAAAVAAALIGACWQIGSRHAVGTTLGPFELSLLRYVTPGLLLAPVALQAWSTLRGLGWTHALLIACGGGLPFGLLVLAGAQFAPASHIGVFMAGAMPLFAALASRAAEGEVLTLARIAGLGAIASGVLAMGWSASGGPGAWRGDLLFLGAAALWAVYTVAFRRSGLTAWQGAAVCNTGSALVLLAALPLAGTGRLLDAPLQQLAAQFLLQGVFAGLLGLVTYMVAVRRLGSSRAALSAAAVPVLTAAGGFAFLGEALHAADAVAIALVAGGVLLASGAVTLRPWTSSTTSSGTR